ncbi:MAG: ABC transporter permease [Lewinellaceae bacterium]|jgi:peptide/nickel transport system permease protein|nr:ABC transporter permease [Lewinellaceae bacterium]
MVAYILRRLAYGLLVMALVVVAISSIIFLAPVDPAQLTFGQRSDVATVQAKTAELGLDQPLYVQLGHYLADVSPVSLLPATAEIRRKYRFVPLFHISEHTDLVLKLPYLRESFQTGRPVVEMLGEAIPPTALLAGTALLLAVILGIALGILASLRPHSVWDQLISVISVFGYSLPSYVAAMLLALVFGYALGDRTGLDIQGSLFVLDDFGEWQMRWRNLILPSFALGLRPVALITQLTRSAMLDVLSQDYVRTATAKGLSARAVIVRHALRNALNPIVSAVSGWFAALLTGAFFVENVFNFKGLGATTVTALLNFDIPVVLGCVLFTSAVFIAVNLVSDLLYAWLDPRVRIG